MHELLPQEIFAVLERGGTVVTANQRAAHWVRRAFNRKNRNFDRLTWQTPTVLAWENWTARLWTQLIIEGKAADVLLGRTQEHMLWRQILDEDKQLAASSLHNLDSLAETAASSWRLLWRYGAESRLTKLSGGPDVRAFQRWAQAFADACAGRMISAAQLESRLALAVRTNLFSVTGEVLLSGFDFFAPAQIKFLEELRSSGAQIAELTLPSLGDDRVLLAAPDERDELYCAARWINQYLSDNKDARVAFIVPDLEEQIPAIDRIFREVLAPQLEDVASTLQVAPWEFSFGATLARTPMVATALNLLRWVHRPLSIETISQLLQSPWFAMTPAERNARAEFDAFELRHLHVLRPELSLTSFISMVATSRRKESLPHLLAALRSLERIVAKETSSRHSWTEWAEHFGKLLDAALWGTETHEDSIEFQIRRRWESALDELASLNLYGGNVDYSKALASLEWITNQTMFAPESREAPIQIMGPLEAAGARFDALWFLRAGELTWPVLPQRNALLPWHLQREFGMPGVEITRDDEHARRITDRIAASAGTIIFSYGVQTTSGHQQSSSLLERYQLGKLDAHSLLTPASRSTISLELAEDAEPLPLLPDAVTRGGAEILRLQAACGFRAFAERRLWSAELKRLESGMDTAERGNIVHQALQFFWTEIKTHATLVALLSQERDAAIERAVDAALEQSALKAATAWEKSYIEMQRVRLVSLMRSWLDLEAARSPFTVSISEHEFDDVRVGPLRMKVRVDRVDKGEEGEIFIDYKSGSFRPSAWLSDRPDQPQLPLYTILSGAKKIEGVAFGLIRAGEEMTLTGYATTKGTLIKSVALKEADTLEQQIDRWRDILTHLAEDFYSGRATVDPKHYPSTCEHCAQRIFCRFDVASAIEEDAGESDHG